MKRWSTALTLMTALAAVASASTQPDEHAELTLASMAATQELADALDARVPAPAEPGP